MHASASFSNSSIFHIICFLFYPTISYYYSAAHPFNPQNNAAEPKLKSRFLVFVSDLGELGNLRK